MAETIGEFNERMVNLYRDEAIAHEATIAALRDEVESLRTQLAQERAATTEALVLTTRYAGEVVAAESDLAAVRTDLSVARRELQALRLGEAVLPARVEARLMSAGRPVDQYFTDSAAEDHDRFMGTQG